LFFHLSSDNFTLNNNAAAVLAQQVDSTHVYYVLSGFNSEEAPTITYAAKTMCLPVAQYTELKQDLIHEDASESEIVFEPLNAAIEEIKQQLSSSSVNYT
jgi:hypothetical protein